jgi:arsenite methyltransferase
MASSTQLDSEKIRDYVRERYGAIATQANESAASGCGCSGSVNSSSCCDASGQAYGEKLGYTAEQLAAVPAGADLGLGCGNPLAIASIQPGETVLDLGSGAGFDCFLAARQLKGSGRAIGVDMTPAMVSKARANARQGGFANVEFRLGEIEALPVADGSIDLIMSNCVINLSPEKPRVLREAFRVLRPGGRLAIADIVATQPLPAPVREKLDLIGACVAGAALVGDLQTWLAGAGFRQIEIKPRETSRTLINEWTEDTRAGDFVVSALITATKPRA